MIKKMSLQFELFVSYMAIMLIVLGIVVPFIYITSISAIREQSTESLLELSDNMLAKLDAEIENLNQIANRIIFSYDYFDDLMNDYRKATDNEIERFYASDFFQETILAVGGSPFNYYQISIHQDDGLTAHYGRQSGFEQLDPSNLHANLLYKETLKREGYRYTSAPFPAPPRDDLVIALAKAATTEGSRTMEDVVEVRIGYEEILEVINGVLQSRRNESIQRSIYIFNERHETIYPLDNSKTDHYLDFVMTNPGHGVVHELTNPSTDINELVILNTSKLSEWTVVLTESDEVLTGPVIEFQERIFIILILLIMLSFISSFFISRRITTPLKQLNSNISAMTLENLDRSDIDVNHLQTATNELGALGEAYADMCQRLNDSIDQLVTAKTLESEAKMLALQSQINPHFLYNTLTIMSIMAEDAKHPLLVSMFDDLTELLRYVTVRSNEMVPFSVEIDHVEKYLNLVKLRFDDDLIYTIDIDDDMMDIIIPKLIIQPFVENSIKYITENKPPWKINISGYKSDDSWQVIVQDNGSGFDKEKLAYLEELMAGVDRQEDNQTRSLTGLGVINVYQRMKLVYGDRTLFDITNFEDGGSQITIGVMNIDNEGANNQ